MYSMISEHIPESSRYIPRSVNNKQDENAVLKRTVQNNVAVYGKTADVRPQVRSRFTGKRLGGIKLALRGNSPE